MNVTGEIPLVQGRGRASSMSKMVDNYEESSYYQRSTSLPRQMDHPYEFKKGREMIRTCGDGAFLLHEGNFY